MEKMANFIFTEDVRRLHRTVANGYTTESS
jgi:hypothetical protein